MGRQTRTTYYHGTTALLRLHILSMGLKPGHPNDPYVYLTTDRERAISPYAWSWTAEAIGQHEDAGIEVPDAARQGLVVAFRLRPDQVEADDWNPNERDQYKVRGRLAPSKLWDMEVVDFPDLSARINVIRGRAFMIGIRRR